MSSESKIIEVRNFDQALALRDFFNSVWQEGDDVVPLDIILATVHAGGYAAMVLQGEKVIAGSYGFLGQRDGELILHSHATASLAPGVGFELKQHQLRWASARRVSAITWTFDPLIRRNCVFNFEKLGAQAIEYLPNFYGAMGDVINVGDESDRFFAYWSTSSKSESLQSASQTAISNENGAPILRSFDSREPFWVELPVDIESLRKVNALLTHQWRLQVRAVLQDVMESGGRVVAMRKDREAFLVVPKKKA